MENVPQVLCPDFDEWELWLESIGYKNYVQILNAKDYGIPQNRKRCFMVSLLGEYSYEFPQKIPLKLKLKDMLEENVDEKYYLSSKMIEYMTGVNYKNANFDRGKQFARNFKDNDVANTITTAEGQRASDTFITIKNATEKGYLEAKEYDGVDISGRMETHRGTVQKETSLTIKTTIDCGVVVPLKQQMCDKLIADGVIKENDTIRHSYTNNRMNVRNNETCVQSENNISPTLDTRADCLGVCVNCIGGIGEKKSNGGTQYYMQDRIYDNKLATNVNASINPNYIDNHLRIRKLTPKECLRLMGVRDADIDKMTVSNAQKYKQAGNSIVVDVLMAIFKQLY